MNDTEWYLIGGLIAAGVVILILLFLLFKGSSTHGVFVETGEGGVPTKAGYLTVTSLNTTYVKNAEKIDSLLASGIQPRLTRQDHADLRIPYSDSVSDSE
jgi:uncharacterized membrane protein YqiK